MGPDASQKGEDASSIEINGLARNLAACAASASKSTVYPEGPCISSPFSLFISQSSRQAQLSVSFSFSFVPQGDAAKQPPSLCFERDPSARSKNLI